MRVYLDLYIRKILVEFIHIFLLLFQSLQDNIPFHVYFSSNLIEYMNIMWFGINMINTVSYVAFTIIVIAAPCPVSE